MTTRKSDRDARLALATLTDAGYELLDDASAVVDDVMATLQKRVGAKPATLSDLLDVLTLG